jgi:HAD superfamily hydrolase (TIGR01509 family)
MNRPPAAVLWDMDGTLVDTEPYWIDAERRLVESFGNEWPDHRAHAVVGFDLHDTARYMIEHGGIDWTPEQIIDWLLAEVIKGVERHIPWRPGARELLADLGAAGVPCALVTMSWRSFVEPVLAALPPGSFAAIVCGDEVANGKPHPEPYARGARLLGVDPADCVAIEDSPTGMASALAAGCRVIGVPNVRDLDPTPGALILPTLSGVGLDLLSDVDRWEAARPDVPRRNTLAVLGLLLAAVLVAVGAATFPGGDDTPAAPPPGAVTIDVWAPYWTLDRHLADTDATRQRLDAIRELSPFWFTAADADTIVADQYLPEGEAAEFMDLVADSSAELVPAILDLLPAGEMAGILIDPATRARHVAAIVAFAAETDADGIDIDYEQFAFADDPTSWPETSPAWVAFITELGAALRADGRTLSVSIPAVYDSAVTGDPGYWVYDHGAIAPHVDSMRIMAYDFSTATAGPIAPVAWVAQVLDGVLGAVAPEFHDRIVLGVPAYGYNWPIATVGVCPADAPGRTGITPASLDDLLDRRTAEPVFDPVTVEWSLQYDLEVADGTTSCTQTRRAHWVDAEGVAERVRMARRAGVGGVALWAFGYDDAEVWSALVSAASEDLTPTSVAP